MKQYQKKNHIHWIVYLSKSIFLGSLIGSLLGGCASLSTPAIKFETGETLGAAGKFEAKGRIETARMFPIAPISAGAAGVEQRGAIYQGSLFGIEGRGAIFSRVDLLGGSFYSHGGGGWRVGAKLHYLKRGIFNGSAVIAHGRYSARGKIGIVTTDAQVDLDQSLSGSQWEFIFPTSLSIGKENILTATVSYSKSRVLGASALTFVEETNNDLGFHLGFRRVLMVQFPAAIEFAMLRVQDDYKDQGRYVPYMGVSFGILF